MTSLENTKERLEQWQTLLHGEKKKALLHSLEEAPPIEVAEFLCKQSIEECGHLLLLFPIEERAEIFENIEEEYQLGLYDILKPRELGGMFAHMSSDVRVDFYQKLTNEQKIALLPYLPKEIRQDVITLSIYPSETAGGIMSTDFVSLPLDLSVQKALELVRREAPSNKMVYYLYVVDKEMKMLGFVMLRDLVVTDPSAPIQDILHDKFVFTEVEEDREAVARKIEKYDLMALPVLNGNDQLVGIVSYDDAMDVIRREQTEDLERLMGIVPDERKEDYLGTSSFEHFKKRIKWLVGLFFLSFVSSFIVHRYESLLKHIGILALYLTTINDAGGNAGSQTATVVIRALSLGQVTLKSWIRILIKEAKVALMAAFLLSVLTFFKVMFFSQWLSSLNEQGFELPAQGVYYLGFIVALALSLQVIVSTLIGAGLPIMIKWMGEDPALAASPAITTIVDSTGLLIYFTISLYMFSRGGM